MSEKQDSYLKHVYHDKAKVLIKCRLYDFMINMYWFKHIQRNKYPLEMVYFSFNNISVLQVSLVVQPMHYKNTSSKKDIAV